MSNVVLMIGKMPTTPICVHVSSNVSHGTAYMSAMVNLCACEDKTYGRPTDPTDRPIVYNIM